MEIIAHFQKKVCKIETEESETREGSSKTTIIIAGVVIGSIIAFLVILTVISGLTGNPVDTGG